MRPHPAHLTASLLAVALATSASPSLAAWPHDPHSGNVPLSTFASNQVYPRMFPDGAGGAFIAWHELRATYDLYVQRVSASGAVTWGAAGVAVCNAAGDQANAALCSDGAGGVIVAWHDARGLGAFDIYVQRLNAAGVPQWTANGVAICTATDQQVDPQLVSDGAGGAILTWQDARLGANVDVFAQRVNAFGVPQWAANGINICSATGLQLAPVVVSDGAGGAIVTWTDIRASGDIYAQRLNPAGTALWAANGTPVCAAVAQQNEPSMIADGTGGAIIAWTDFRSGSTHDVYAQRLTDSGSPLWTVNGVAVFTATDLEQTPVLTTDGAGGAIIACRILPTGSFDIIAQRLNSGGVRQWAASGVAICSAFGTQEQPCIASDGAGGAIIGWSDERFGSGYDLYAQRVSGNGIVRWVANGLPISTANNEQSSPFVVADGAGGAILAWHDERLGAGFHRVHAQRIDRFGELGNAEETITSVRDTPNDQGGQVKVSWSASYLDVDPTYGIVEYRLWRSAPQRTTSSFALEADDVTADSDEAAATGKLLVLPNAANAYAWELVDIQPAAILPSYSLVTATTSDSVLGSNPRTAFMIEALAGESLQSPRWFSPPDSGYSVDNLPPATPAPFSGVTAAGSHDLDWGANSEADLAGYRLYRGVTADFVPGPVTLLSEQAGVGYLDATDYSYFYKLSAVDAHGNESGFASFAAQGSTTDVGDAGLPMSVRLACPEPNPARASAHIAFHLPRAAHVVLAVHDAGGRMVRALVRGERAAGRTGTTWDLRDAAGRDVASGIYFIRLEVAGRTFTRRMVAIR